MSYEWQRGELEELFGELVRGRRGRGSQVFVPAVDVSRNEDGSAVTVVADLAGVDPTDVELSLADGILTIAGTRQRPISGRATYQQIEIDYGPFERRVAVGSDADSTGAEAVFDRGLLTVRLPVRPRPAGPMRVVITVVRQP